MLQYIFPKFCVLCARAGKLVCDSCDKKLVSVGKSFCLVCGRPFQASAAPHPCSLCLNDPPEYDAHRSLFVFNDASQKLIHDFKYRNQFGLKKIFERYFETLKNDFSDVDLVVAVPLHVKKLKHRGYNQSQILAKSLASLLDKKQDHQILIRSKNTCSQTGLNKKDRQDNLCDAFSLAKTDAVRDKKILLVDDVHTTGVTLNTAARILKQAQAHSVFAVTLAIVDRDLRY